MMTCEEIRSVLKTMMNNVAEAREKIHKANEYKDRNRGIGDWFKMMSNGHLEYNMGAMQMVKSGLQELRERTEHTGDQAAINLAKGKCEAYEEWLSQIVPETAEVKAMIDAYGR